MQQQIIERLGETSRLPSWSPQRRQAEQHYRKLLATKAALEHGRRVLLYRYKVEPTPQAIIWFLLGESLLVWRSLPDRERTWLGSGKRGQHWEILVSAQEWFEVELARLIDKVEAPESTPPAPIESTISMVDVATTVSEWFSFLKARRNPRRYVKVVMEYAMCQVVGLTPSEVLSMLWRELRDYRSPEQALLDIRTRAVGQVMIGLRETLGVQPTANRFV